MDVAVMVMSKVCDTGCPAQPTEWWEGNSPWGLRTSSLIFNLDIILFPFFFLNIIRWSYTHKKSPNNLELLKLQIYFNFLILSQECAPTPVFCAFHPL